MFLCVGELGALWLWPRWLLLVLYMLLPVVVLAALAALAWTLVTDAVDCLR